jgi:uncharacterized protein
MPSSHIDPERYQAVDLPLFREELDGFLPPLVYDSHVHVALPEHRGPVTREWITSDWPNEVDYRLSIEQLAEVQALLFPGRRVRSLVFAMPSPKFFIEQGNRYVAEGIRSGAVDGLLVTRPEWSREEVLRLVKAGGYLGFKPYPGLVGTRADDIPIPAFLPPHHQEVADELGLIVLLHIGRPERLRDPANLREIRELATARPNLRLVIAHIGRAYTMTFAEPGLAALRGLPGVYHDFAMNLNADVLELALQEIGPERLLYGSDLPIALMRGVREHEGDRYINFSDGDYAWNTPDRRKPPEVEGGYTLYLYEQLRAFRAAATRIGLTPEQVARVMGGNASAMVQEVSGRLGR